MVVLNIFHVLIAIAMVALILVQRGAGATAGAAFGSGASGTVFGARGAGTFLSKSTWVLATLFCTISLTIAVMVSRSDTSPEANLGVIASTPAAAEEVMDTEGEDQGVAADQGDLPALLNSQDEPGALIIPQDPVLQEQNLENGAVEDLPVLDGGEGAAIEGATESIEGNLSTGAGSDDS